MIELIQEVLSRYVDKVFYCFSGCNGQKTHWILRDEDPELIGKTYIDFKGTCQRCGSDSNLYIPVHVVKKAEQTEFS